MLKKGNMQYRMLGNSGLSVSVLALGNWLQEQMPFQVCVNSIKKCLQNGINHFDTAELYGLGRGQELWGKVFKEINEPRQNLVIASKIWKGQDMQVNSSGTTNRKHVKEGTKRILAKLQMEYLDVIYSHGYDDNTPIQQTCRAFHQVIQEGLVFYWAISNWQVDQIMKAFQVCEKYNLHKPICGQNHYNMIVRGEVEDEYRKLYQKYNFGICSFSPLEGGLLTGKYLQQQGSQKSRFGAKVEGITEGIQKFVKFIHRFDITVEQMNKILIQLKNIAEKQLGCKLAHLAIAWSIKFKYLNSCIFGARNVQQIQDNLKSLDVVPKLTEQVEARINKILGTNPEPRRNFRTWQDFPNLRP